MENNLSLFDLNKELKRINVILNDLNDNYYDIVHSINNNSYTDYTDELKDILVNLRKTLSKFRLVLRQKRALGIATEDRYLKKKLAKEYNRELEHYNNIRVLYVTVRDFYREYEPTVQQINGELAYNANELENPSQLQQVYAISSFRNVVINENELTGDSFDNPCMCYNGEEAPDGTRNLCRVDCPMGHVFHCYCINTWRNTRKWDGAETDDGEKIYNGWNNYCPICRKGSEQNPTPIITERAPVIISRPDDSQMTQFGKYSIKQLINDIKYLKIKS